MGRGLRAGEGGCTVGPHRGTDMPRAADRFGGKPFSQINLTPLVGVLLAVFAGVLTIGWSQAEAGSIQIEQPGCYLPPPPGTVVTGPPPITVSLGDDGSVSIEGRPIDRADFVAELRRQMARGHSRNVWVRADGEVQYGVFMGLLNDIQAAGDGHTVNIINEELE